MIYCPAMKNPARLLGSILIVLSGLFLCFAPARAAERLSTSGDPAQQCQQRFSDPKVNQFGQVYLRIFRDWLGREEPQAGLTAVKKILDPNAEVSLFRFPTELGLPSIHAVSLKSTLAILAKQANDQLSPVQRQELDSYVRNYIQDVELEWAKSVEEIQTTRKSSVFDPGKKVFKLDTQGLLPDWTMSNDGKNLAVHFRQMNRYKLLIFDVNSAPKPVVDLESDVEISKVVYSENSEAGAVLMGDRRVQVWNPKSGVISQPIAYDHFVQISDVALSPDGRWMALATLEGKVEIYDLQGAGKSGKAEFEIQVSRSKVKWVQWLKDGSRLITMDGPGDISVWNWATRTRITLIPTVGNPDDEPWILSPDQRYIVTQSDFAQVCVFDLTTQKTLLKRSSIQGKMRFSPDSGTLAVLGPYMGSDFRLISTVNPKASEKFIEFDPEDEHEYTFDPSGRWILMSSVRDGTLRWWDLIKEQWVASWLYPSPRFTRIKIASDRKKLFLSFEDSIEVYDYPELLKELELE